jgi:hypothetical protein
MQPYEILLDLKVMVQHSPEHSATGKLSQYLGSFTLL